MNKPTRRRGAGLPRLSRHYQHRWACLWKWGRPVAPTRLFPL
ncbi:hypothetical protein [Hymenobacter polaris]|nr:hypothetical protein [Hymenobacter polaris]